MRFPQIEVYRCHLSEVYYYYALGGSAVAPPPPRGHPPPVDPDRSSFGKLARARDYPLVVGEGPGGGSAPSRCSPEHPMGSRLKNRVIFAEVPKPLPLEEKSPGRWAILIGRGTGRGQRPLPHRSGTSEGEHRSRNTGCRPRCPQGPVSAQIPPIFPRRSIITPRINTLLQ